MIILELPGNTITLQKTVQFQIRSNKEHYWAVTGLPGEASGKGAFRPQLSFPASMRLMMGSISNGTIHYYALEAAHRGKRWPIICFSRPLSNELVSSRQV